jgi:hypothetical protein
MHEALFRAFFESGKGIAREDVLLEIGTSVGLDREGLGVALEEGRYTGKVLADVELARRLGVGSVRRCSSVSSASRSREPRPSSVLSLTAGASKPPSNGPRRAVNPLGCIFSLFGYLKHGPRSNRPQAGVLE